MTASGTIFLTCLVWIDHTPARLPFHMVQFEQELND
jgi:hypothetical protein